MFVPRAVYDPEDAGREDARSVSELEAGLRRHRRIAVDSELSPAQRERSMEARPHFEELPGLVTDGTLTPLHLTLEELRVYAQLRDPGFIRTYGLTVPLGAGEAAALAIAEGRAMRLATNDQDCIKVASARHGDFLPLRIRGLLRSAVELGLVAREEASSIHLAMISMGFWDKGRMSDDD